MIIDGRVIYIYTYLYYTQYIYIYTYFRNLAAGHLVLVRNLLSPPMNFQSLQSRLRFEPLSAPDKSSCFCQDSSTIRFNLGGSCGCPGWVSPIKMDILMVTGHSIPPKNVSLNVKGIKIPWVNYPMGKWSLIPGRTKPSQLGISSANYFESPTHDGHPLGH